MSKTYSKSQLSCNKIQYPSEYLADKACEEMKLKNFTDYRSYYCYKCESWHITHKVDKYFVDNILKELGIKRTINGSRSK